MIGMIESFKMVEVFGDEGGASLMAGSISKALITTAAGLVIAMPAIAMFYFFKHRLHQLTLDLERGTERVMELLFDEPEPAAAEPAPKPSSKASATALTPAPPAAAPVAGAQGT